MRTSEAIDALSAAMAAAQGEMKPAIKDATNPHFKSKYADLSSVFEAVRGPFAKHGLSVWQELGNADGGVTVSTRVVHKTGQWVEFGPLYVPAGKQDAQGLGSAATYARRYGLASALGVCADEDDDGHAAASGNGGGRLPAQPAAPAPKSADVPWTIKATSPEDFAKKFVERMAKAPDVQAATKLHDDNDANLKSLSKELYESCALAYDMKVGQHSKQAAE
jgi:hypothetical protein